MALDAAVAQALLKPVLDLMPGDDSLKRLASLTFADAGRDVLETAPPAALAAEVKSLLEALSRRAPGRASIRLRPVSPGLPGGATTAIEVVNDDMPFLVDSVVGELQALGLSPTLLLHPILKVARGADGTLERITGPGDRNWGDGQQESVMLIHVDRLDETSARRLVAGLEQTLLDVRAAVTDWRSMLARLDRRIADLEASPPPVAPGLFAETLAFLRWLREGQFTFLGLREYALRGGPETGELLPVAGSSLGVLRDPSVHELVRDGRPLELTAEVRRHMFSPDPLVITKSDIVSRVHRRVHMDYIGIKSYGPDGRQTGETRLVGLLTSQAYTQPIASIPLVRHKADHVIQASGYPPASHAGKTLANILDTLPREEMFRIQVDDLKVWAEGMLDLDLRPRTRLFVRRDRFDRFVSALVYVARDRFSTSTREQIAERLCRAFDGTVASFTPFFPEGPLVRVHFIITRHPGPAVAVDVAVLEREIDAATRSWDDRLEEAQRAAGPEIGALVRKYRGAFSAGYTETFTTARALADIERIERLGPDRPVAIDFYREPGAPEREVRAAIYRFDTPIPLSDRVPVLENLGLASIDERSYRVKPRFEDGRRRVALHDMVLESVTGAPVDLARHDDRMEETYLAVYRGEADNDPFNRLVVAAGADWRQAATLRAYAAYMRQIRSPFGPRYIADTLCRHAGIAREIIRLFQARFDPLSGLGPEARAAREAEIVAQIEGALAGVPSLDEDRILRQCLGLVRATVRTNVFRPDAQGRLPSTLAFKLDSKAIDDLPEPRPYREIWVYSPRVEAVHLRFGAIARGGIRWSDRAQDFRTEVLALCKAQQVKNTVIVPTGAKGGFLPKQLPRGGSRDDIMAEGIAAYRIFVSAMLDITDNIRDGRIVPPPDVVRHDGDDPYLVVAADKGTATFSDFANELSTSRSFWLGDAFASGGSAGYDHKKMAITARGAWECVKRHFREIDIDIQTTPFRVVGVGDMSGDVFGNGMLLSPMIRLVAAFDHRDIFIDPDPDPATSFAERKRLFELPRSSWQDYDRAKISAGGGVFSRGAKSIALTPEMRALLNLEADHAPPHAILRAILAAETDLLWFGGIGTYVRAASETDEQVGDRANDMIRITGAEVRAKVIGEGANLALTQKGRIEAASRGVRLNTDFIDNSAGVNSSDKEVNIKIALGQAIADGRLAAADRNALLAAMTNDVAAACVVNNYQQGLAISLAERRSAAELGYLGELMRALEARGLLDRRLEALPSDRELRDRELAGRGLTRPEIAVLLSWSKIALNADLLASTVPDDPATRPLLIEYFPPALRERFAEHLSHHRLAREIVATRITNSIINRGGPAFVTRLADETGRGAAEIAHAYLAARSVLGLPALWAEIDALDGRIAGAAQLDLYAATQGALLDLTAAMMRSAPGSSLEALVTAYRPIAEGLPATIAKAASPAQAQRLAEARAALEARGVPAQVAERVAMLAAGRWIAAIARLAEETGRSAEAAGRALLAAEEELAIAAIRARAETVPVRDYYERLALSGALGTLDKACRLLAASLMDCGAGAGAPAGAGADSAAAAAGGIGQRLSRAKAALDAVARSGEVTVARLVVAASQVRELSGG